MRILMCLHASPSLKTAGVEVYCDALAQTLGTTNDVALLYPGRRDASAQLEGDRDTISHFAIDNTNSPRTFLETYRNPRVCREIDEVFATFRPDIVHVQHLMGLSSELPTLAQARGIPVVMTVHDYWLQCAAGGQRFNRNLGRCDEISLDRCATCTAHMSTPAMTVNAQLERLGLRVRAPLEHRATETAQPASSPSIATRADATVRRIAARLTRARPAVQRERIQARWDALLAMSHEVDQFIVPSTFMHDEMIRFGLPEIAISQVDLGVAPHHAVGRRHLPDTVNHFAYLGGITRHKGVHKLVEAINSLPDEVRTTIWGDESDDPTYAKQLRKLATHPGITFAGKLAQHDVPKQLREVDALVVPSLWHENAPLVIREAFSAGIPVVATRLGGNPELLASGGGLLFDPDEPRELERCLTRLMRESGLARRLVEKQPRVKTMAEHAQQIGAIYRDVVNDIDCE